MIRTIFFIPMLFAFLSVQAQHILFRGVLTDQHTGDFLTGAQVTLQHLGNQEQHQTAVGLDGTFLISNLREGSYTLRIHHVGYTNLQQDIRVTTRNALHRFDMVSQTTTLESVGIEANYRGTDTEARNMEKQSANVMNVISSKQIELSPDITVANVIQRVSGLSVERNTNGDPQYAIVRGMNQRYNNTLINGIKIPSPNNDNRFVPLDIFPAVFLEKLAVYKSLSADMEADAIGGTIDMVMKSAPRSRRLLEGDIQIGGNTMSHDGNFSTYDRSEVYRYSPAEYFGPNYEAVPRDFSPRMFSPIQRSVLPDVLANASYGDRFFKQKLGVLVGASFQQSYRPNQSYFYDPQPNVAADNRLNMRQFIERRTSTEQQRMAFHAKVDYDIAPKHTVSFYGGHYLLNEFRVREQYTRENFTANDNYPVYPLTRITNTYQTISVADLSGKHALHQQIDLDWHAVYSRAKNELPDDGVFVRSATWDNAINGFLNEQPYFQDVDNSRAWERNQDQDLSFLVNASYRPTFLPSLTLIKMGGLYRTKARDNYYNYYLYSSLNVREPVRGESWFDFGDLPWDSFTNPYGSGNNSNMVYDADEQVAAAYIHSSWAFGRLNVQLGLRGEHTQQGYEINALSAATNETELRQQQRYFHLFPSASFKYGLAADNFLKATYYKAISRPGFFEIVPTIRSAGGGDSFYSERGNPDLRPTIAHNLDVRYELFPTALDQILIGAFYKKILDPIEFGFPQVNSATDRPNISRVLPQNFGDAQNIGLELDYTRYLRNYGLRLNYTYTNSRITTTKLIQSQEPGAENPYELVDERRSLQGQSAHVGNISLLYKDPVRQWDAQLVLNYTGERLAVVSPFQGTDQFMSPMSVLDFSLEKGFGRSVIFLKANNLLNTPYKIVVNRGLANPEGFYPYQEDPQNSANVREDRYGLSFRLGLRFKL